MVAAEGGYAPWPESQICSISPIVEGSLALILRPSIHWLFWPIFCPSPLGYFAERGSFGIDNCSV
jgi:hypothetical protein